MDLDKLKSQYNEFVTKYSLPSFKELNETFEIERIEKDTDLLLRQIRKVMVDKIVGYIRFFEILLNPSQAPLSYMSLANEMSKEVRESLNRVYKPFIELELRTLKEEIDYSEVKEAERIKEIYETWNKFKEEIKSVMASLENSWNIDRPLKKEKDYFG